MRFFRITSLFLMISASAGFASQKPPPGVGTLSGRVMINETTPMENAVVLLFNRSLGPPPHPYNYWRVPDMIMSAEDNGAFSIDIPEGEYFLMIAQKNPESDIGPPGTDEFLYFHSDKAGNAAPLTITSGKKLELGQLTGAFFWLADQVEREKGVTSASGVVVDSLGKPVSNVLVFAYVNSDATGRPSYVSDRTDNNGSFNIRFYDGGTYYLKVRGVIGGGRPRAGEFMNVTKDFEPVKISLKKDEKLKDFKLKVKMFTTPAEKSDSPLGKEEGYRKQQKKLQSEK